MHRSRPRITPDLACSSSQLQRLNCILDAEKATESNHIQFQNMDDNPKDHVFRVPAAFLDLTPDERR
ncbi:hypothetical protein BDV36DRAFT_244575 [Aspergillus pseudocaelatus]|uniref:Uncharacterized protein n=1 Tax=Aspergillus pseudocaelatus TaxID=1825620 RepID=A0ABQ6X0D3_9EURO|nr:hypothetical protein BDV36DRAFT_244575 [Aspergillus pseudocaelatus]